MLVCPLPNTLGSFGLCSHHIIRVLFLNKQFSDVVGHYIAVFHNGQPTVAIETGEA